MLEEALSAEPAQRFGPYTTSTKIGQGGMGVVYRARRDGSASDVALKTVRVMHRRNLAGIRAEIKVLASLRHQGIVRVEDFGVENGAPWFAMELLQGQTLKQFVAAAWGAGSESGDEQNTATFVSTGSADFNHQERSVSGPAGTSYRRPLCAGGRLPEVLAIVRDLCQALSHLHGIGLLHGDLKPSNVFVCSNGRVVLLDFGLVGRSLGTLGRESIEGAGAMGGTMSYSAPERLKGDFADARADLFSVGVLLYEALTGRLPFSGADASQILEAMRAGLGYLPSHLVSDVPPAVDQLTKDLLAFSPLNRIGHAEDVVNVLESFGAGSVESLSGSAPKTSYLYRPPLAGRGESLSRLVRRVEAAVRGEGGVVVLMGESGTGKTSLLAELARQAKRARVTVISGECIPVGAEAGLANQAREAPLHPFRPMLQDVADRCREWDEATIHDLLAHRAKLLVPYEATLAGIRGFDAFPDPPLLPAEAALPRLLLELRGLLGALPSIEGPLVLLIDDLQWADELSVRLLESLTREFFQSRKLLVVATIRSDEVTGSLRALLDHEDIELVPVERLGAGDVEEMVGGMLAMRSPPAPLVDFLSRHSEGNPFFVAEYLRLVVAEGFVTRQGGHWTVAQAPNGLIGGLENLELPGSIRELVSRRLDLLSADARALLEVAAVVGRKFDAALLAATLGVDESRALEWLRESISFGFVRETGSGAHQFSHDKLREVAYARLSPELKRTTHARVARQIEASVGGDRQVLSQRAAELAHHFKLADDPRSALTYLELAGEAALARSAHHQAASFLAECVSTANLVESDIAPARRARWERMMGDANLALGELDRSLSHFREALRSLGMPQPEGRVAMAASTLRQIAVQAIHGLRLRRLPTRAHAGTSSLLEKSQIHGRLLQIFYYTGATLPMLHAMINSLNLAELAGPSSHRALGYVNTGATAGILSLRKLGDHYCALARATIEAYPNAEFETFINLLEGHHHLGSGSFERARSLLLRAMELSEDMGFVRRWEENADLYLSLVSVEGRFDEARVLSGEIVASSERGDKQVKCWGLIGRAQSLLALDEADSALEDARRAAEIAVGQTRSERLRAKSTLAAALARSGDFEAAAKAADVAMVEIEAGPLTGGPYWLDPICGVVDVRLAAWDRGSARGESAAARLAVMALRRLARVFPFARARAALYEGYLLNRLGRVKAARKKWSRGTGLASSLGLRYDLALNEIAIARSLPESHPDRARRLAEGQKVLGETGALYAARLNKAS
jgi:serine/threonine protein kinase/tetratricopeptide (TPR) repeat protein